MEDSLDRILCTLQVVMSNFRNFHWNMRGDQFISFHEFFGDLVDMLFKQQDEIAEWIKGLGDIPPHTLAGFIEGSAVREVLTVDSPMEMMEEAYQELETIETLIKHHVAEAYYDQPTENMILNICQQIFQKKYWIKQILSSTP